MKIDSPRQLFFAILGIVVGLNLPEIADFIRSLFV